MCLNYFYGRAVWKPLVDTRVKDGLIDVYKVVEKRIPKPYDTAKRGCIYSVYEAYTYDAGWNISYSSNDLHERTFHTGKKYRVGFYSYMNEWEAGEYMKRTVRSGLIVIPCKVRVDDILVVGDERGICLVSRKIWVPEDVFSIERKKVQ